MPIKVLHIENDADDALLLRRMLQGAAGGGFMLARTERLSTGLEWLESEPFDVVLLDLSLSDSHGLDTFRKVREKSPHLPVIVLSGLNDEAVATETVQAGAQDYLCKDELNERMLTRSIRYAIERHRADRDLNAERILLRSLIDSLPDQIYVKDCKSRFIACNTAVAKLYGMESPDAMSGKSDYDLFPKELAEKFFNEESAVLAGHPRVNREERVELAGGEQRWLLTTKVPLRNPDGMVVGLVGNNRDITERKRTEDSLVKLLADLKKAHDALKAAQLQLIQAEKMETLGRLAAGVAHEVKNPLAVAMMGLDYLKNAIGAGQPGADAAQLPRLQTVMDEIYDAIKRADTVIAGLLDFSRPRTLILKPENLNEILEQSLLLVRHELAAKRIGLRLDLAVKPPGLRLDGNKVKQVFINLCINAIQAMPDEGMLRVRTFGGKAGVLQSSDADFRAGKFGVDETVAGVHVEDNGPGISAEHLAQIFEPFFTTKPAGQGTGLGLPVVKQIVEMHGGTLDIRNRSEGGVRATVILPAVARAEAEARP